ncbi:MAG: hypothetical protein P8O10_03110 [Pseudorhodobacter sp.]|nr:hypothetical protein [Pseudorhodobacter sp.]
MAIPLHLWLTAVDFDARIVNIQGDGRDTHATPLGSDHAIGQFQHRLAQDHKVRGLSYQRDKA